MDQYSVFGEDHRLTSRMVNAHPFISLRRVGRMVNDHRFASVCYAEQFPVPTVPSETAKRSPSLSCLGNAQVRGDPASLRRMVDLW